MLRLEKIEWGNIYTAIEIVRKMRNDILDLKDYFVKQRSNGQVAH